MRFFLYLSTGLVLASAAMAQVPATPMGPSEQAVTLLLSQSQEREKQMATAAFELRGKVEALTKENSDLKAKLPKDAPTDQPTTMK